MTVMNLHFRRVTNVRPAHEAHSEPFALPCRLGNWQLLSAVGAGPLARVYRARRFDCWPPRMSDPHPIVAVKVLRRCWQDRPRVFGQFVSEAAAASQVRHPHLLGLIEAELRHPPYFLVTPWVAGTSLSTQLSSNPLPSVTEALAWARQLAEALAAMADAGWMHADVKPANILIGSDHRATLIDLGFARRIEPDLHDESRPLAGTLNYMAPEMLFEPHRADQRADLYSLGATLFEMLTGRLPFISDQPAEVVRMHRETPPPSATRIANHIPLAVSELIGDLLAKDPDQRPASPTHVAARLAELEQVREMGYARAIAG